jgi:O-acetyl-ADP-ribose deacetylase (regulator of RNase III)
MINPKDNIYAYLGQQLAIPSENINNTGFILNERAKFTLRTGMAIISTANANLDGTGTVADLITAAASGTIVKRIVIKAQGTTTQGMVRIFFKAAGSSWLMREIAVPPITQAATAQTLIAVIDEPFNLKASYLLRAATQNAETFIVTAEAMEYTYPA